MGGELEAGFGEMKVWEEVEVGQVEASGTLQDFRNGDSWLHVEAWGKVWGNWTFKGVFGGRESLGAGLACRSR